MFRPACLLLSAPRLASSFFPLPLPTSQDLSEPMSRREILTAFRRNRQHADILKCPPRIRQHDGTMDKFYDVFLQVSVVDEGHCSACLKGAVKT